MSHYNSLIGEPATHIHKTNSFWQIPTTTLPKMSVGLNRTLGKSKSRFPTKIDNRIHWLIHRSTFDATSFDVPKSPLLENQLHKKSIKRFCLMMIPSHPHKVTIPTNQNASQWRQFDGDPAHKPTNQNASQFKNPHRSRIPMSTTGHDQIGGNDHNWSSDPCHNFWFCLHVPDCNFKM